MKAVLYLFTALCVIGLAFWAYRENYATQASINQVEDLQDEIARLRELFRSTVDCCGAAAGPHCVARLPHCFGAACCGVRAPRLECGRRVL